MPALDTITILHSAERKLMTKQFTLNLKTRDIVKTAYQKGMLFTSEIIEVSNINELAEVLTRLESNPYAGVIRGALIEPLNKKPIRRLFHDDHRKGAEATIKSSSKQWIMIDVDGVTCPVLTDPVNVIWQEFSGQLLKRIVVLLHSRLAINNRLQNGFLFDYKIPRYIRIYHAWPPLGF